MRRRAIVGCLSLLVVTSAAGATATATPAAPATKHLHNEAVAEAENMLTVAPVLPNSTAVTTSPSKYENKPWETELINGLVTRGEWWTVDESAKQAIKDLTATTPAGYRASGSGESGPIHGTPYLRFASLDLVRLPAGIYSGELQLEAAPLGNQTTGIAVFAQAVPQPPRPAREVVPSTVHKVSLAKYRGFGHKQPSASKVLRGTAAARVVSDFDAMKVEPGGTSSCGGSPEYVEATFSTGRTTWTATIGACYFTGVDRNGHDLPTLDTTSAFFKDVVHPLRKNR